MVIVNLNAVINKIIKTACEFYAHANEIIVVLQLLCKLNRIVYAIFKV